MTEVPEIFLVGEENARGRVSETFELNFAFARNGGGRILIWVNSDSACVHAIFIAILFVHAKKPVRMFPRAGFQKAATCTARALR